MNLHNDLQDGKKRIEWMSYCMALTALIVAIMLQFVKAPYGRYSSMSWGFGVPARLAWFIQELPSLTIPLYFLCIGGPAMSESTNRVIMTIFVVHYIQRTLIFPFLIRGGKPTPLIPFLMAFTFCVYNGYMQSYYHSHLASYSESWIMSLRFILGILLFFTGMGINIHSDHILRNLRKPGESGYKIPTGGLFEYVSGANFFGEIVEWFGFALASGSLPALSFFIFTALNIGPRAVSHHKWYLDKFGSDYPSARCALIPFIF